MAYQQPPQQQPGGTPPSNYMVGSIIAIFCCWPFAIPAIVNAAKVNSEWAAGNAAGAEAASQAAKKWMTIAFVLGIIYVIVMIIGSTTLGWFSASTSVNTY